MARNRSAVWFGLFVIVAAGIAGVIVWARWNSNDLQDSGTHRMARRLAELANLSSPYMAGVSVGKLQEELQRVRDVRQELMLRMRLMSHLVNAGQTQEAIEQYQIIHWRLRDEGLSVMPNALTELRTVLATAYLRLGEQENCIHHHGIDSCLLPIRKGGVHTLQRGARSAIEELTALLAESPENRTLGYRWLLNIAYMTVGEYPDQVPSQWLIPPKAFESDYDINRFYDVAPQLGLDVFGLAGGSVMEDFDGDGDLDLMFSSWGPRDQMRYFRSNGDGTFTEHTESAGLTGIVSGLNLCHADYDNDGYPDVLVLRGAWLGENGKLPNSLLHNNGDGTFEDVTEQAGLLSLHPTQTASWGDYNNDGWLDLFIGNETIGDPRWLVEGSSATTIHTCELYHNNGDGTFTECAAELGLDVVGFVKGVAWGDFNNDGWLDLYISRSGQQNILFRNDGPKQGNPEPSNGQARPVRPWTFTDITPEAGVQEPLFSFPIWFWDYNNDGHLDLFVAGYDIRWSNFDALSQYAAQYLGLPYTGEIPRLYRNNGDGTFGDMTRSTRLDKFMAPMGCNFGDLDNDGFPDCYLGTGAPGLWSLVPNRMFRNAEGQYFQDVTTSGGFGHLQKGHGISFGDLDNDGDQDIHAVMGGFYEGDGFQNVLFENPGHGNRWITLQLEGTRCNRAAIGTRIRVSLETPKGPRDIYVTVSTGASFGSSSFQQEIGLGQAASIRRIELYWPASRQIQVFENVAVDQTYKIREGDPNLVPVRLRRFSLSGSAHPKPDTSEGHHHHEH